MTCLIVLLSYVSCYLCSQSDVKFADGQLLDYANKNILLLSLPHILCSQPKNKPSSTIYYYIKEIKEFNGKIKSLLCSSYKSNK